MTALALLAERGRVEERVPLGPLTTYKFGGPARYLVTVEDATDAGLVAELVAETAMPVLALGRGSNLVVSAAGFGGVVVRAGSGLGVIAIGPDGVVAAGAAAPLPRVARDSAREGRGGLEFFTGIPGSVGGAVRMNAGCHGSDTAAWLIDAVVVDLGGGGERVVTPEGLEMSYRSTNLRDSDFVVSANFRTVERSREEAEETIREITRWRREHQPGGTLNAGSVFKNPPGDAAGRIIDDLGLKGLTVGGARVSPRHANFFEAERDATAADVHALVMEVRRRVADATGIILEPEIRFVGDFS
jgi:UDP-N-acetylmuramate dehydrogenase